MPYIGKQPLTGAYQLCDTITTSATATYNLLVGGSAVIPGSANNCIVSLNGVVQAPVGAFTVSGSTITFASTLSSADVIDFILILGNVFDIGTPTNGAVTNSSLNSNVITGQTAETTVAGGDLVLLYDDSASALRKMTRTNFVSGLSNTPAFFAQGDQGQTAANNTATQITYNLEIYDTDNCFASSIFTPNVAGKYFCYASVPFESNFNSDQLLWLSKNSTTGNSANSTLFYTRATFNMNVMASFDMNGTTDTIRVFIQQGSGTTQNVNFGGNRQYAYFGAFRILGA